MNIAETRRCKALVGAVVLWGMIAASMFLTGCADGYESPNGFDSGVRNTQMESPDSVHMEVNAAGDQATISWPLVKGAECYEVSFLNVDDPENPVAVDGYDQKIVDGPRFTVGVKEDTRYILKLRTLGNKKLGNTDEAEPKVHDVSTLVPSLATIPDGVDIYEWWQENNPLDSAFLGQEVAIELQARGHYTMSGQIDFQGWNVTFRGDKLFRPIISMTGGASFAMYAGLKMKFLNFDLTDCTAGAFLYMSKDNLPEEIKSQNLGYERNGVLINNIYVVKNPVYISDCMFKNVPKSFVHDNSVNTAWWYFTINKCIIQLKNNTNNAHFIDFSKAAKVIKNLTIQNSTIYDIETSSSCFMQLNNSSNANPAKVFGDTNRELNSASELYKNSTLIGVFRQNQWKKNGMTMNTQTITFDHCLLVDMYRLNKGLPAQAVKTYRFNVWWCFEPLASDSNTMNDWNQKDTSGLPLAAKYDPQFPEGMMFQELDLEKENGGVNFTPGEYEVVAMDAGDPLWLNK